MTVHILTSDDAIEAYTEAHCMLIRASGQEPTDTMRQSYREGLQALVKLARSEYALGIAQDMNQAHQALR